ncbi:MAG: hypothetical protein HY204_01760 [Nitrospirae bacterium]|nr:hypothetical protein [Nitrospirota bacterium]
MKKLYVLTISTVVFFSVLSFFSKEALAVPAFARQTGMACAMCHFQHYPALNPFGMAFKMNGYTLIGSQGKVEGADLSLPDTLNASLVTKIRYQKSNGVDDPTTTGNEKKTGTNKGELQFPDEAALLIGGRAGEHVGFLLEAQLPEGNQSAFASFKMPIVYPIAGITLSAIPFTTDGGGAAYGFELLNTGAINMQRVIEEHLSAQDFIGTATEAEGVAFVAANSTGFLNVTLWAPEHGSVDAGLKMSHYLRLAATPNVGGWSMGIGGQYWGGKTEVGDTNANPGQVFRTKAWAADAQAQGMAGTMPLGVYLTYGSAAADANSTGTILFNCSDANADGVCDTNNPKDKTAWSALVELGVLPGKATVALGYRAGKNGAATDNSDNALVVGATYLLAQNVEFQLNHALYSGNAYKPKPVGGDQLTTLMIFAAF